MQLLVTLEIMATGNNSQDPSVQAEPFYRNFPCLSLLPGLDNNGTVDSGMLVKHILEYRQTSGKYNFL